MSRVVLASRSNDVKLSSTLAKVAMAALLPCRSHVNATIRLARMNVFPLTVLGRLGVTMAPATSVEGRCSG